MSQIVKIVNERPKYSNSQPLDRNVCTPIKVKALEELLVKTNYNPTETQYITKSFKQGFSLGYKGPKTRRDFYKNIPFTPGVANKYMMWEKSHERSTAGTFCWTMVRSGNSFRTVHSVTYMTRSKITKR